MTEDHRELDPAEIAEGYRRDLAYWRELLRSAPSTAHIAGRLTVAAPAGAGRNRGNVGIFETRIDGINLPSAEQVLAAYFMALSKTFGIDHLIIDKWFTERHASGSGTPLGPMDSFYPLLLHDGSLCEADLVDYIQHADAQARLHLSADTPALLRELTDYLRERKISLRQFGFAYIDPGQAALLNILDSPLDAIADSPHEIQLSAAASEGGCSIRLKADVDVVSQAQWPDLPDFTVQAEDVVKLVGIANMDREIPITTTQRAALARIAQSKDLDNAETVGSLGFAFKISPSLDRARFAKAMDVIVARHDVMRTRFVEQNGAYHAYHERVPSQVFFTEQAAGEAAASERAHELLRESVRVTDNLFKIVVIDTGAGSDVIVAMAHHIGMDGYSLGLIIEEAFQAFLGMELPKIEMDIDRFAAEFDHVGNPESLERRDRFLQEMFADPPPVPNIGRKAKGLVPNHGRSETENAGRLVGQLSPEQQDKVRERAKASGATEAAMVMAAFADTLSTLGGVDEVILSVPFSRRHSRRLEYYANFVASEIPVRIRPSAFKDVAELAAAITAKVDEASEHAPFIDALWSGELHDSILSQGSYSRLYLAGEITSRRWTENSISGSFQRPDAGGVIEMGPATINFLPGLPEARVHFLEIDLRSLASPDGLTIVMRYDTVGFTPDEAQHFLDEILRRVEKQ
jgi:hypothetical protein